MHPLISFKPAAPLLCWAMLCFSACASAQNADWQCGPLVAQGQYGPFDYRTDRDKQAIVVGAHFTPEVEALIRGTTSVRPGADIDYTLRAIPNNHRALLAMVRLAKIEKTAQPSGSRYTLTCWFERALLFRPDDSVVRMLYSQYLYSQQDKLKASQQLDRAVGYAKDNGVTHYNLGLHYFDQGLYEKARVQAHTALALGVTQSGLREQLSKVGQWREPSASSAEPTAKPASE